MRISEWPAANHTRVPGARGAITADIIKLFLIGLPALFAGTWLGLKLFGRLNEAAFRKIVLVLLLASGVVLIV